MTKLPSGRATLCSTLAIATALMMGASPAAAQALLGTVRSSSGVGTITNGAGTTTVAVTSPQAVINWSATGPSSAGVTTFSNAGSTTSFTGQANFAILNRVAPTVSGDSILINGNINSSVNGQVGGTVYFYSPNGIVIGGGATINVGSLGLTTLPIGDVEGVWMSGFGTAAPHVAFGAATNAASFVRTAGGGVLGANGPGNYVALVAPHVEHRGTIRTDSGAALVAAGAATVTFRPSGLYDITVTTGSGDANGVVVDGGRIERNNAQQGGAHRAYLVSVPANNAMTMLVRGGAQLGFDIAGAAAVEGNAVVLSTGHNIVNGAASAAPAATAGSDGDLSIIDSSFTSRVAATALDHILVDANSGTTRFSDALTIRARQGQIEAGGPAAQLLIGGNLGIDASRTATAAGAAATSAGFNILTHSNGIMTVAGTTSINASARGGDSSIAGTASGAATGGTVFVQAQSGSTLNFTNGLTITAGGTAGSAGAAGVDRGIGQGGSVFVDSVTGNSRVNVGGVLSLEANGSGGTGSGGNVHLRTFIGANNNITVTGATSMTADGAGGAGTSGAGGLGSGGTTGVSTGTTGLVSLGTLRMSANGTGGIHAGAGTAGAGRGGSAFVNAAAGGAVSIVGAAVLTADARGGLAGAGGTGGTASGGTTQLVANGGALTVRDDVDLFADADGGAGGAQGGNATGGTAVLRALADGDLSVGGNVFLVSLGAGGNGHVGGSASGGSTLVDGSGAGSSVNVGGTVNLDPFAFGGSGSGFVPGGLGGNAVGGNAGVTASEGAQIALDSLFAFTGASGGDGATGGNASGGQVNFGATGAGSSLDVASSAFLDGSNSGGTGRGGAGGSGTGGIMNLFANGGTVTLNDVLFASADGHGGWSEGSGAAGGVGRGGQVNASASVGGALRLLNSLFLSADGFGGGNFEGNAGGGAGFGGSVGLNALGGGATIDARLTAMLSADGWGGFAGGECTGCGGAGGDGTGGSVSAGTGGGADNRLLFGGDLSLSASGFGSAGFGGTGGAGVGGSALVSLVENGQVGVTGSLALLAVGSGGDQGNGRLAGNGTGGNATISVNGTSAALLSVGLATLLDTSGRGGSSFGAVGGTGGQGDGGFSRIVGTGGRGIFTGAATLSADAAGGQSEDGFGGDGVGGQSWVNSDGAALEFASDLSLHARSTGGAGGTGGDAIAFIGNNAPATATTDARILARNGTVSVAGFTELDVSAEGGAGSGGGAGGNAAAGYATVHSRNSDLGPATITLGTLFITAGASGGDGGIGTLANAGGNGGSATGGFIAPSASAGNGNVNIGATIIDGAARGGDGGRGGGGDLATGGAGGAGGAASGARLFIGTESAESAALSINQGSARFASILAVLDAFGGAGGAGGSGGAAGIGGRGGAAAGGNGEIAVRGSLLQTGPISLTANAFGGRGGFAPDETVSGAGGNATAGGLVLNVLNRFGNPAMRGTLDTGAVTMTASALGGAGATDGLGHAGGRNLFNITNSDARMASFAMLNAGSDGGDPAARLDPFILRNATVAVAGDFTVVNPAIVSLWSDGGNLSAANFSLSAGNFIRDFTNAAAAAPGTITARTISLSSGRDIIVDAHLSGVAGLTINAPQSIAVGNMTITESEEAGDISVAGGASVTTGAVTGRRGVTVSAGGTLTTGALNARDDIRLNATGAIAAGPIATQNGGIGLTGNGGISAGDLTAGGDVVATSGGTLAIGNIAARSADLTAAGTVNAGNATTGRWFEADATGALRVGNVTAGEGIELGATGALAAGNLSAGLAGNTVREGATYSIGILSGTSVALGDVNARDWIGVGTRGALAAGTIASGNDVLLLADGAIATGGITTGAQSRLLVAGADMIALGGPVDGFDRSRLFTGLGTATEAATRGTVTLGTVGTGRMDALVGTDLTTGAVSAATAAYATAGGTVIVNGVWTAPLSRIESNDLAIGASGGIAGGRTDLVSRNATQLLVGDGLTGSGYALDNAEFGRLSAAVINILGRSDASAAIDTAVGTLTLTGRPDGRSVTIATVAGGSTQPAGTLRVSGAISGTGLGASDTLELAAGRVEVDATTGGISLLGSGGELAGALSLTGQRVHVAETAIIDRLATDPNYAGRDADLARSPATQRADGVVRAADISIELGSAGSDGPASYSVLVQNSGTARLPAGFTAVSTDIVAPDGTPPGSIDLNVSGQLVTATGALTGAAVRGALIADGDPARFTAASLINGCALLGPCGTVQPTQNAQPAISTEIALLMTPPADDPPFGNEEAIEDNEEESGDDSASSPISPPAPLFNTKPLEQKSDTDEPVSGGGNPALIGSGPVKGDK